MTTLVASLMPPLLLADVIFAFRTSSFFSGKLIVIILFAGSILAWTVMTTKFRELKRAQAETTRFLGLFRRETHPLNLFLKEQKYPGSPVYRVYESACSALGAELEPRAGDAAQALRGSAGAGYRRLAPVQIETVRNVVHRGVAHETLRLESKMGVLATAVSASPFLGLLGTVWGVLDAFSGMAMAGAATLASVAPGISAALLTTVVGLLVALPSAIGYNVLTNRIRRLCVDMDNFAQEFMVSVQRALSAE